MYNYTDSILFLTVPSEYLADNENVHVTFRHRGGRCIDIETSNYNTETGVITLELEQSQLQGMSGKTFVQVNGFLDGKRWASEVKEIEIKNNLLQEVIE